MFETCNVAPSVTHRFMGAFCPCYCLYWGALWPGHNVGAFWRGA